ncbi:unnamed protein product [Lota lota]
MSPVAFTDPELGLDTLLNRPCSGNPFILRARHSVLHCPPRRPLPPLGTWASPSWAPRAGTSAVRNVLDVLAPRTTCLPDFSSAEGFPLGTNSKVRGPGATSSSPYNVSRADIRSFSSPQQPQPLCTWRRSTLRSIGTERPPSGGTANARARALPRLPGQDSPSLECLWRGFLCQHLPTLHWFEYRTLVRSGQWLATPVSSKSDLKHPST